MTILGTLAIFALGVVAGGIFGWPAGFRAGCMAGFRHALVGDGTLYPWMVEAMREDDSLSPRYLATRHD